REVAIKYSRRNENIDPLRVVVKPLGSSSSQKLIVAFLRLFCSTGAATSAYLQQWTICLGISLSISFCFFTLCIMFFVLFLGSLCWMLLSAV
ncbi:hypothetical protein HID58_092853, partial [Brassica napus]